MQGSTSSALMLRCVVASVTAWLTGCATVTVHNGTVEQTRHFGLVNISVKPDVAAATVVITRSFGLAMGTRSGAVGYLQELAFIAPDAGKCRVMLVIRDLVDLQDLQLQLISHPALNSLCISTPVGVKS